MHDHESNEDEAPYYRGARTGCLGRARTRWLRQWFRRGRQLGRLGYDAELETLTEAALLYTSVAQGDIDIFSSAWPVRTQSDYWDEYSENLEVLNSFYDNGTITLAVPDYVDIQTIPELAENPEMFDGKITGIEPGAGQMQHIDQVTMPEYGMHEDFELTSSSFAAMLATLQEAVENEENIVVSNSRPHWSNAAFNLRDLEDPDGIMGEPEPLQMLATAGFSEDYPEIAEYMAGIHLEDDAYTALENLVMNEYVDEEEQAVQEWLGEYPDAYETLITD
ncbi:MAG: glycine betaine ABC transporter substrate-binding protein [Leucobacter sp.]